MCGKVLHNAYHLKDIFTLNTLALVLKQSVNLYEKYSRSRNFVNTRKTCYIKRRVGSLMGKIEKNGLQILVQHEILHKNSD